MVDDIFSVVDITYSVTDVMFFTAGQFLGHMTRTSKTVPQ